VLAKWYGKFPHEILDLDPIEISLAIKVMTSAKAHNG